jgi:lipopolysaccharide/colanic/teichoic acid biosynthesis glycosyltransferase
VVALFVRRADGRPLLFVHERAGLDGRPFGLLKFRTMRPPASPGEPDAARITRVGRVLRRSSLDELPELWNVVRGEMNLVGPRPLPVAYTAEYSPAEARRLEVKPGVTGLVQVRGRNALTWEEKFALDTWYVEHRTWRLDLRILLETPLVVLRGGGISHSGHATMPEFKGQRANGEAAS